MTPPQRDRVVEGAELSRDALLIQAGAEASRRGWSDFEVVEAGGLTELAPTGQPVVLITEALDTATARAVAMLTGAGRVVVVVAGAVESDALPWLPEGVLTSSVPVGGEESGGMQGASVEEPRPASGRISSTDRVTAVVDAGSASAWVDVRACVAASPHTSQEVLVGLASDPEPVVAYFALANEHFPNAQRRVMFRSVLARDFADPRRTTYAEAWQSYICDLDDSGNVDDDFASRADWAPWDYRDAWVSDPQSDLEPEDLQDCSPRKQNHGQLGRYFEGAELSMGRLAPVFDVYWTDVVEALASVPPEMRSGVLGVVKLLMMDALSFWEERDDPVQCFNELLARARAQSSPPLLEHISASSPTLSPDLASRLAKSGSEQVAIALAENSVCPPQILAALATHSSWRVQSAVAWNPACQPQVLQALARHDFFSVRGQVARRSACPPELLELLARDDSYSVRERVAGNPSCPLQLLQTLARDDSYSVRERVAGNPSCSPQLLEILAHDERFSVRSQVAGNPSSPLQLLETLARDEYAYVRSGVAGNPSCPPQLLETLAGDGDRFVRWGVAGHPSCPPELLETLAHDQDSSVRRRLAAHPACSPQLLTTLASDGDSDIRPSVAGHPSCPPDLLEILARDEDAYVRMRVASNRSCPPDLRAILARDQNGGVCESATAGPGCPPDVIEHFLLAMEDYHLRQRAVKRSTVEVLLSVSQNPDAPMELVDAIVSELALREPV